MPFSAPSGGTLALQSPSPANRQAATKAAATLCRSNSSSPARLMVQQHKSARFSSASPAAHPSHPQSPSYPSNLGVNNCDAPSPSPSRLGQQHDHQPQATTQSVSLPALTPSAPRTRSSAIETPHAQSSPSLGPGQHRTASYPAPPTALAAQSPYLRWNPERRPIVRLRSARNDCSPQPSRPLGRNRNPPKSPRNPKRTRDPRSPKSPKSPIKRPPLASSSDSGNRGPASAHTGLGAQQHPEHPTTPRISRRLRSVDKMSRHGLNLDVSASPFAAGSNIFGDPDPASILPSEPPKRSNAALFGPTHEPSDSIAHNTSAFSLDGHQPGPKNDPMESSNPYYELAGSTTPRMSPPSPTLLASGPKHESRRRSASLRKSTLQQRQHDRTSWGRRSGSRQLARILHETTSSTPLKQQSRPRLSDGHFAPLASQRESPFVNPPALPNPQKPAPAESRRLSFDTDGNMNDNGSGILTAKTGTATRGVRNFSKSLPVGSMPPHDAELGASGIMSTPRFALGSLYQPAFLSTGLVSKVNRNPELNFERKQQAVPDTPCKKPAVLFNTFPPPQSSASKRQSSTALFPDVSTPSTVVNKRLSLFSSSRSDRRLFDQETEQGWLQNDPSPPDASIPPTPTKTSSVTGLFGTPGAAGAADIVPPSSTSRHSTSTPSPLPPSRSTPHTPSSSQPLPVPHGDGHAGPPDSRSSPVLIVPSSRGSALPVTPTTRDGFNLAAVSTPSNARGDLGIDGSLVNRFAKIEPLGKGQFSAVFKVTATRGGSGGSVSSAQSLAKSASVLPTRSDKVYAVKKSREPYRSSRDREAKMREVQILQTLRRANHVIRFIDSWEDQGHLYIQTEYCEEGTLGTFLEDVGRTGRLDDFRIWKVLQDVTLGLIAIHGAGFVHLDLKPSNVLITFEGVLKIADFGLAQAWPVPSGADVEGDRVYLAPESLESRSKVTSAVDIYSLGLMLVEMACNINLPQNGISWQALRQDRFEEVPTLTLLSATELHYDSCGEAIQPRLSDLAGDFGEQREDSEGLSVGAGFRCSRQSELEQPPGFMSDRNHPGSLDQLYQWMLACDPAHRPTAGQILETEGIVWVNARRQSPATVYEGSFGPSDECSLAMVDAPPVARNRQSLRPDNDTHMGGI